MYGYLPGSYNNQPSQSYLAASSGSNVTWKKGVGFGSNNIPSSSGWNILSHVDNLRTRERPLCDQMSSLLMNLRDAIRSSNVAIRKRNLSMTGDSIVDLTNSQYEVNFELSHSCNIQYTSSTGCKNVNNISSLEYIEHESLRKTLQLEVETSGMVTFLQSSLSSFSFLEMENHHELYYTVFQALHLLVDCEILRHLLFYPLPGSTPSKSLADITGKSNNS